MQKEFWQSSLDSTKFLGPDLPKLKINSLPGAHIKSIFCPASFTETKNT